MTFRHPPKPRRKASIALVVTAALLTATRSTSCACTGTAVPQGYSRTWWFYALSALVLVSISTLVYRNRTKRLEAERTAALALVESEARYRRLTDNAQDVIFRISLPDGNVEYINPAAIDFCGYMPSDFYNDPSLVHKIIHPAWQKEFAEQLEKLIAGTPSPLNEYQIVHRSGDVRWVHQRNVPIIDANGTVIAVEGIISDITARKLTEHELQQRNRSLEMLNHIITTTTSTLDTQKILEVLCTELATTFELAQAAATIVDHDTNTATVIAEYLTPGRPTALGAIFDLWGNPANIYLMEQKKPLLIADAQHDERLGDNLKETRRRGIVSLLLIPVVIRDRVISTVGLDAIEPRTFTEDEIALAQSAAAAAGHALETTELYQRLQQYTDELEQRVEERTVQLHEAMEQAQMADRAKSEFVSNVSHELRTPLTNIKLYFELVKRGRADKRTFYMDTVTREVLRLQHLIENLLNVSRLDLGRITPELSHIDVEELVSTLVIDRQKLFDERGLHLQAVPSPAKLPKVHADAKLLEEVLTNLLTNAYNYTPGGGQVWLKTALAEKDRESWITISVKDTGLGIAPEEQEHLFQRFYRGTAGTTNHVPGTGLGLAISKEILELHQGRITVESELGEGSTFTVWLPCNHDDDACGIEAGKE